MEFICYPKCTTCKKAQNWLESKNAEYTVRNIKEENPTYDELREWYVKSGLPLKRFFNTSGMIYRSMNLKDKLDTMTDEEKLRLLAEDGMLVKRPILIKADKVLVGFREAEWEENF